MSFIRRLLGRKVQMEHGGYRPTEAGPTLPPSAASAPPPPIPVSTIGASLVLPTAPILAALGWASAADWAEALRGPCRTYGINTRLRLAAFLANVGHETGGGRALVESLNYTPAALVQTWPSRFTIETARLIGRIDGKPADQRAIAEKVYGGRMGNDIPGDGWRYRGRGLMQLTGKANYERFARMIGMPLDDAFLAWLETPSGASESAAHFWSVAGCNAVADKGDIAAVRRIVNGGTIGLDGVRERFIRAQAALAAA